MNLFSKALLKGKKVFEPIVDFLYLARVKIIEPADYNSPSSDYSYVEAEATATGSKYIYVYIAEQFYELFDEMISETDRALVVKTDNTQVSIQQYNSSARRFAIGNLANTPTGTYNIYVYNAKTNENIYEIKLNWKNDYI